MKQSVLLPIHIHPISIQYKAMHCCVMIKDISSDGWQAIDTSANSWDANSICPLETELAFKRNYLISWK